MSASDPPARNGPEEEEPLQGLLGSVFDLADQIASRIPEEEIEARLQRTLQEIVHPEIQIREEATGTEGLGFASRAETAREWVPPGGSSEGRRPFGQEEFFRQYWPRLLRFLIVQASDSALAEEVAADTFTSALDNWDNLVTLQRPDSWLFKVGIRKLRRLEERARSESLLAEDVASTVADLRLATEGDEWVGDHLDLVAAMRALPRRQSEVIALRSLMGYTVTETAQILGITEGTVKSQLGRALGKLRMLLGDPAATEMVERKPS